MGRLADELRKHFSSPQECLAKLGLDSSLLDDAWSTKAKARKAAAKRGMAIDGMSGLGERRDALGELEALLAEHLDGEVFELCQRALDRVASERAEQDDGEVIDEREDDDDEMGERHWLMKDHETERPPDEELAARRRWLMRKAGDHMREHGEDEAAIRDMLEKFPKTGLEHLGGALDEDVNTVMGRLTGMGGGPTPLYQDRDMVQSKDRKRRAHDRKLALDAKRERNFLRRFPEAARLTPRSSDFANYGDREPEPMAMDERQTAEDYDRANAWFGLDRIKTNAI